MPPANVTALYQDPILDFRGCLASAGLTWAEDPQFGNYDDVPNAGSALFMALTSGYLSPMWIAQDTSTVSQMPIFNYSERTGAVYFVALHMVFSFFLLNIFIGVVSVKFSEKTGKSLVTDGQKTWNTTFKTITRFDPVLMYEQAYKPEHADICYGLRLTCFKIATSHGLLMTTQAAVMINALCLATDHYPLLHEGYDTVIEHLNIGFMLFFLLECIVKIIAFGPKNYFTNLGLLFDFSIVAFSLTTMILAEPSGIEIARVARAMRLFSIAKGRESLVSLMGSVVECLLKASDVLLITFMLFYVYAIIGMNTYGKLPMTCGDALCFATFETFPSSMMLLFQVRWP
jgi:hypothetical protein